MESKKTTAQTKNSSAKQPTKSSQNTSASKTNQPTQKSSSAQKNTTSAKSKTNNCAASTSYKAECAQDICKLTDKDIISDVLGSQKALITLYSTALCESSCKNMRTVVTAKLAECAEDQFDMFLYMNQRGMYPTENATAQKLTQAKTLYAQEKTKMK